jgi:pimeloyl-ACP methyl ester carboxylesterase
MNGFSRVIVLGMVLLSMINCSSTRDPQPETARPVSPPQGLVKEPVFGGEVFLQTAGNPANPAVVLVHGLGNEAATAWEPTMEFLRKDFFVFAFDLPGFGRSSKVNALYSPENYGRLIHYLTQKYVRKPFHLVGHSMGGAISLQYAADYPQDVQTLTLVDAAGVLHRLAYSSYLAPLGIDFLLKDYNVFSDNVVADVAGIIMNSLDRRMPVDLDKLVANALFRQKVLRGNTTSIAGLALVLNDFSAVPEKIKAPTLIIWGDEDNIAPLRTGVMLRALIPQSSLRLLSGGFTKCRRRSTLC